MSRIGACDRNKAGNLLRQGRDRLQRAGIENTNEARTILSFVLEKEDRLIQDPEEIVSLAQTEAFFRLIARREAREPLQYIVGSAWFYGYRFCVSPKVLIPRFDTENLVEAALRVRPPLDKERVLDLCTGSGAIGLAFGAERKKEGVPVSVTCSDISPEALTVAEQNRERIFPEAELLESDLFRNLENRRFHLILSNPPYVTEKEMGELMPEVKDHEPHLALYGGRDGLDLYKRIIREAPEHLEPEGHIFLEIGCSQGKAVAALLENAGFGDVHILQDLNRLGRVVTGQLKL